jgi:hypothetical protein
MKKHPIDIFHKSKRYPIPAVRLCIPRYRKRPPPGTKHIRISNSTDHYSRGFYAYIPKEALNCKRWGHAVWCQYHGDPHLSNVIYRYNVPGLVVKSLITTWMTLSNQYSYVHVTPPPLSLYLSLSPKLKIVYNCYTMTHTYKCSGKSIMKCIKEFKLRPRRETSFYC